MSIPRKLFSPFKIGPVEVKNRIALAPMGTCLSGPDAKVTEQHIKWYEARAKGGTGLIIVEGSAVSRRGTQIGGALGIWDDAFIPGFRQIVDVIHDCGAKTFLQLIHGGRQTSTAYTGGELPVAPSAIPCPLYEPMAKEVPHKLSLEEIGEIVTQFQTAAGRARKAGFDGLEIHGAHGYLPAGFMSPYANRRHDAYGGDLPARMKFPLEIIKKARDEVGPDFPIGFRFSADEFVPDGLILEEGKRIARILEAAGVDYLHVSGGTYESLWALIPAYGSPEGFHVANAAVIKQIVSVPVMAVGNIRSPEATEEIIAEGKADMVALGRQLICDPDWPIKTATGDFEDIRPCIGCTQGCLRFGLSAMCIYNTSAGIEKEAEIKPAKKSKRILVVGGGPGGLEAARVAALRGHHVILCEKTEELGGRFNLACIAPFKQRYSLVVKWLSDQVRKLGVEVVLGKEITPELVEEIGAEAVIVATGAVPFIPSVPGVEKEIVVFAEDILAGNVTMGNEIVILGGGGVGCDLADFMSQRGKKVTIVEALPEIGAATGIPVNAAQLLIPRLLQRGVKIVTNASAKEIIDDGVVVTKNGRDETISGMDQVAVAMGVTPCNELAEKLKGKVAELYVIGDAKEPRTVMETAHEGAEAARVL